MFWTKESLILSSIMMIVLSTVAAYMQGGIWCAIFLNLFYMFIAWISGKWEYNRASKEMDEKIAKARR